MLYTFMIKLSKKELDKELKSQDGYKLAYRLISFINIAFSIREKFKIKVEEDNVLCGLKRFYNIIKHDYCPKTIFDSMCLPREEERKIPVFMDISNIKDFGSHSVKKDEETQKYEKYVKGKPIKDVANYLFNKTMELLKANDYI